MMNDNKMITYTSVKYEQIEMNIMYIIVTNQSYIIISPRFSMEIGDTQNKPSTNSKLSMYNFA